MKPTAVQRVFAMARPARPSIERDLVRLAAGDAGTASAQAKRVAQRVAATAMEALDRDPADRVVDLIRLLANDPITILATDAEIDTAAAIRKARRDRMEGRGYRRQSKAEADGEDEEVRSEVAGKLAERYRRLISQRVK